MCNVDTPLHRIAATRPLNNRQLKFAKYYHEAKQKNPSLTDEQIAQKYEKTQQGKQAMNTRLLGGVRKLSTLLQERQLGVISWGRAEHSRARLYINSFERQISKIRNVWVK